MVMGENKDTLGSILIAEDEPINFMLLQKMLEKTNYSIIWAKNGEEAIEKIKENDSVKLVLMDIRMPKLGGIDATIAIRAAGYKTPIYAVTAYTLSNEREKCEEAGTTGFLTKPVNPAALLNVVNSLTSA